MRYDALNKVEQWYVDYIEKVLTPLKRNEIVRILSFILNKYKGLKR